MLTWIWAFCFSFASYIGRQVTAEFAVDEAKPEGAGTDKKTKRKDKKTKRKEKQSRKQNNGKSKRAIPKQPRLL